MHPDLKTLWKSLTDLHHFLRAHSQGTHSRMNPFFEDLFSWTERGAFWTGKESAVTIYNSATLIGDVRIGERTWVGPFCLLDGGGGLQIGRNCSISTGCHLLTHDTVKWALSGGRSGYEYERTRIGDCCFLGCQVVVTKGVRIGNHCLIAAGAVVTQDVQDFTIAAGVPAKPIGKIRLGADGEVNLVYHE
jgi:carbonic anhydrase/acetyltransferase-like protein (isoleucine patch superfamily)